MTTDETSQVDRDTCYFCGIDENLERHHIFPQRYGGSDEPENLVDVCKDCHQKLERLYDVQFWDKLNISRGDSPPTWIDEDEAVEVEIDAPKDEVHDYTLRQCGFCRRAGPFKQVTHQPSGKPAWQCVRCEDRDNWSGLHIWAGPSNRGAIRDE